MRRTNVVEMRDYKPEPRKITTPITWVKQMFIKCQQFKEQAEKKKIDALLQATYNFYLDMYLTGVEMHKLVDIHPALYRQGYTTCSIAYQLAMEALIPVIEQCRVNECYKALQEHIKQMQKIKRWGKRNGKTNR
ncbi:MAG: hypothetical protein IJ681_00250 [Bacteroidales bacterium]|nr:hypothetical protein [Bacteroidales bacterium]